ncbi:putative RNA-dependent RNA polymerase [Talaromyces proteolyticus]|uniref:RNA-dependent RNA polymerase n=1 Tax=Talaromyces proteolyticus TaxID=1131652 RepID=A0AAD4KDH0_9EURO|nr:putative RNA-dependent RNA polymerase [Talaromyces proteolyticus]KAH8689571.1 putative RNA-dependent RNA polymerase [Talaromyces proteolyticus]
MEVFCRNVPTNLKVHHLKRELRPILATLDIIAFECRVHACGHATITIADVDKAKRFLSRYPQAQRGSRIPAHQQLKVLGTIIFIEEGRNKPDQYMLLSLREEEIERRSRPRRPPSSLTGDAAQRPRKFLIRALSCGVFDFAGITPIFVEYWNLRQPGNIKFNSNKLTVVIQSPENPLEMLRLDFQYRNLFDSIFVDYGGGSITFSGVAPPYLFRVPPKKTLQIYPRAARLVARLEQEEKKIRLRFLNNDHKHIVSACFGYRILLASPADVSLVRGLSNDRNIPQVERWKDRLSYHNQSYVNQLRDFLVGLVRQGLPFAIMFQLQMLALNGELPMYKINRLTPHVKQLLTRHKDVTVARVLRELPRKLHYPTPHADSNDVSLESIKHIITDLENSHAIDEARPGQPGYMNHNQIAIHRASVTPTGIYLDGPNPEIKNRVLRRYFAYSDSFLRVRFIEESGDPMMYDIGTDLDEIFRGRFREVLRDGIVIADRLYNFLGFSNSSLRSRTCWFMAPFEDNLGDRVSVDTLIPRLGDFLLIRSPAKFAARLGQTFSDTLTSIPIEKHVVGRVPDVERNGRVFSDGCGTISKEILWRIYRDYPRHAVVNPTVFQIRFSGAKGMLSLDSTLKGPSIRLRDSMIKFHAEDESNIEICGSGIEKLPCYLNAPLIKILEDLGVARDVFLELQRQEIESLSQIVHSPQQAASFLEQSHISKSIRLPWLILVLKSMDLSYVHDSFLKQAVELTILTKLRDLKYKARIRIPKAVTLYGIMDETGVLNEHEIFVPVMNERKQREILVHDAVIITRSPAFHPGDVQLVSAVDVPEDSPLRNLHNCVVFSQKGMRDLPSQLSGGDLDGDLFNIIYDDRFKLRKTAVPADYPRVPGVVLDRAVTLDDIKDFFITFMQQDQLGRIATTHKILADCREGGTFHPDCLTLAELHSTAVDFSKTGTPVDVTKIPRYPHYRPDFMAPGPRVRVAESIEVLEAEEKHTWDDDVNEADDDDDDMRPGRRYYKSQRVLGYLFRKIDERKFLVDLQTASKPKQSVNLLHYLWDYIQRETVGFIWEHHKEQGFVVRDIYEENLEDMMYRYSETPWKTALTEVEVFIGNIMGKNHKQTVQQKEASKTMREEYDSLVTWVMGLITGQGTSEEQESLERSVACFWVAMSSSTTTVDKHKSSSGTIKLRSYPWIAAIACLQEIDKFQRRMPY